LHSREPPVKVSINQPTFSENNVMRFGFLPVLLLAVLLIVGGGFAWLAFTDMPVRQKEITVIVPVAQ